MIARLNELDNNYDKGRTRMWARTGCGFDTSLDELDIGEQIRLHSDGVGEDVSILKALTGKLFHE